MLDVSIFVMESSRAQTATESLPTLRPHALIELPSAQDLIAAFSSSGSSLARLHFLGVAFVQH